MNFELRRWKECYASDIHALADNATIASMMRDSFPHPYTEQDARDFVSSCMNADEELQLFRAIVLDGHAVGSIAICTCDDVYHRSAELSYWLGEPYWGNSIMTRAVRSICKEAFERFDIVRIFARPYSDNLASRHVLNNAGFNLEGICRCAVCKDGIMHDDCIYALLREQ